MRTNIDDAAREFKECIDNYENADDIEEFSPDSSYSETDDDGFSVFRRSPSSCYYHSKRYLRNIQRDKTPLRKSIFVFLIRLTCR